MNLDNKSKSALRTFHMAHNFLNEFGIHWLPVDPYEIINTQKNWYLKYADTLAYEIGKDNKFVLEHVMRSKDGVAMYDVKLNQYDIILNGANSISQARRLWTVVHEIGHIYLGHLDNKRTKITSDLLDRTEYDQLEFEADIFAGEVLASKWIMRTLDIVDENDIALICGISDDAALSRYKKATEEYNFIPANVVLTLHNFEAYLKNITICRSLEDLDSFARFAYQNPEQNKLSKPKPKFLRNENSCPYCGNEIGVTKESCFCIACGSKLKSSAIKGIENCSHVNHQRAAFCESCGNPVYRIKQGFSLEECEI
ncbi:MAG: ImmA/IrrE family metallo-endopeptidase [Christensenellaceae bacterium]